ncbi:hypothetical protein [Candidatus Uabimicrobium sp. HlEnr_7]|uniref:hypothetical protein n=1 Tax=Candidatus Uabimicrobium helgolandensis TaxID=3095367 RepID=UPI003556F264
MQVSWNKWGWFGGVVGGTLWMYILSIEMLLSSKTYMHFAVGISVTISVSIVGYLLWCWRNRLTVGQGMRIFICTLFPAALCLLVLRSVPMEKLEILHNSYWSVLCMFSFLFVQFTFSNNYGPFSKERKLLQSFSVDDKVIDSRVKCSANAFHISCTGDKKEVFSLFTLVPPSLENSAVIYETSIKSEGIQKAYLEMWMVFPNGKKYFSRGIQNPIRGTQDWKKISIPFLLKASQNPSSIELNIIVHGTGYVHLQDVALYYRQAKVVKK